MIKPYYESGGITIYQGDCREILPQLPKADVIFADPPYGVGKGEWDGVFPVEFMDSCADRCDVLAVTPGIANVLRCPPSVGSLEYRWCMAAHLTNGMTRGLLGFSNWIPCLVYAKEGVKLYSKAQDVKDFAVGTEPRFKHPCQKPYQAVLWILATLPGNSIIDPFMGSGTSLRAAKDLGKKAIGIEREREYCDIAIERLAQDVLFGAS
jgi:site-specific DNA-methyltransferase (adenine-specific)